MRSRLGTDGADGKRAAADEWSLAATVQRVVRFEWRMRATRNLWVRMARLRTILIRFSDLAFASNRRATRSVVPSCASAY